MHRIKFQQQKGSFPKPGVVQQKQINAITDTDVELRWDTVWLARRSK